MSKIVLEYDTKTKAYSITIDGKKQPNVKNIYFRVGNPDDKWDETGIEISGVETSGGDDDVRKSFYITAAIGDDLSTHFAQEGELQSNYLGMEIKDPDGVLAQNIANIFQKGSKLFTGTHLNPQQVPHVAVDKS